MIGSAQCLGLVTAVDRLHAVLVTAIDRLHAVLVTGEHLNLDCRGRAGFHASGQYANVGSAQLYTSPLVLR